MVLFGHVTRRPVGVIGDGDLVAVGKGSGEQGKEDNGGNGAEALAVHCRALQVNGEAN